MIHGYNQETYVSSFNHDPVVYIDDNDLKKSEEIPIPCRQRLNRDPKHFQIPHDTHIDTDRVLVLDRLLTRVGFCKSDRNKIKWVYEKCSNDRINKEKITIHIRSLTNKNIPDLSTRFLETWSQVQINLIPDGVLKEFNFEQLCVIISHLSQEKLFRNLKSIESGLSKSEIITVLSMIPNRRVECLGESIKNIGPGDIRLFSTLSSTTIFFFIKGPAGDDVGPVLNRFPFKKIERLAKKASVRDLKKFCLYLNDPAYSKIFIQLPFERKISLARYFQQIGDSDRLFFTVLAMTHDEFTESIAHFQTDILEKLLPILPDDKKDVIQQYFALLEHEIPGPLNDLP